MARQMLSSRVLCLVPILLSLSMQTTSSTEELSEDPDCTIRYRKPWHLLPKHEKTRFTEGFQELAKKGVLSKYIDSHSNGCLNCGSTMDIHGTSQNFFWHSYWIWELETSIRNLGGKFKCFAMPYWDVTVDGEWWINTADPVASDLPIYNSGLGGEGDSSNNFCVDISPWTTREYTVDSLCAANEDVKEGCCLKRHHVAGDGTTLYNRSAFASPVFLNPKFKEFAHYSKEISALHQDIHYFIGGTNGTHFSPINGEPVADPLFAVFHAFIDYLRLLREDCSQYDRVGYSDLESVMPYGFEEEGCDLDYEMYFGVLCTDETEDRYCSNHVVTPRVMFDESPNGEWNVVYELGDFWNENDRLKAACTDFINETWWTGVAGVDDSARDKYHENIMSEVVRSLYANSFASESAFGAVAVLLIAFMALVLLKRCNVTVREKAKADPFRADGHGMIYGTV